MSGSEEVVVAGAGLVGAATAYQLAIRRAGVRLVLIGDHNPVRDDGLPELDSYSIWWPGADDQMLRLVARSIDLLQESAEQSADGFAMNRRGQLLVTTRPETLAALRVTSGRMAASGFGPLREHAGVAWYLPSPASGFRGVPDGLDLLESDAVRAAFPFVSRRVVGALHVRRAGWVNGVALRRWLLTQARVHGVEIVHDTIIGIRAAADLGPRITLASGASLQPAAVVLCPERRVRATLNLIGAPLPLWDAPRIRGRLASGDRILPDHAPIVTGIDRVGGGLHVRPAADRSLIVAWMAEAPVGSGDEIAGGGGDGLMSALADHIPVAATHRGPSSAFRTEGSLQARAADLRPIIGPIVPGVLLNAVHDRPVSSAMAAGDLIARYIFAESLPDLAQAFGIERLSEGVSAAGWRRSRF